MAKEKAKKVQVVEVKKTVKTVAKSPKKQEIESLMDRLDLGTQNLKGEFVFADQIHTSGNISSGHFDLDFAIHFGKLPRDIDLSSLESYDHTVQLGFPIGKSIEMYGEQGAGKSSLAYRIVGNAQKMGMRAVWFDAESSFVNKLAQINGVDIPKLVIRKGSIAETILDDTLALIKGGNIKVIVIDSIAALVPLAKQERTADQLTMGVLPRLLSDNLPKINDACDKHGVTVIFINQLRQKIGVMHGSPNTSPGGRALKHLISLRLQVMKRNGKSALIQVQDQNGQMKFVGRYAGITLKKNRFGPPMFQSIDIPIYFEPYFPNISELMYNFGRELQVIKVRTGDFKWRDVKIAGKKAFVQSLVANDMLHQLYVDLVTSSRESNKIVPPEIVAWAQEHFDNSKVTNEKPQSQNNPT